MKDALRTEQATDSFGNPRIMLISSVKGPMHLPLDEFLELLRAARARLERFGQSAVGGAAVSVAVRPGLEVGLSLGSATGADLIAATGAGQTGQDQRILRTRADSYWSDITQATALARKKAEQARDTMDLTHEAWVAELEAHPHGGLARRLVHEMCGASDALWIDGQELPIGGVEHVPSKLPSSEIVEELGWMPRSIEMQTRRVRFTKMVNDGGDLAGSRLHEKTLSAVISQGDETTPRTLHLAAATRTAVDLALSEYVSIKRHGGSNTVIVKVMNRAAVEAQAVRMLQDLAAV